MRNALLATLGAAMLMVSSGCGLGDKMFFFHKPYGGCGNGGCGEGGGGCANGNCGDPNGGYAAGGHHQPVPRGVGGEYVGPQGPPTGAVAYPYYTSRGPRDFLDPNPPSLGP
jgi:hypothetical protein